MKNLEIHDFYILPANFGNAGSVDNYLSCLDSDSDHLFVYYNYCLYCIPPNEQNYDTFKYSSISIKEYTEQDEPILLEFCSTLDNLFCVLKSGMILKINVNRKKLLAKNESHSLSFFAPEENGESVIPCNLNIEDEISCIKLSPDHELLVIVTKQNIMYLLYTQYDLTGDIFPICEEFLESHEFGLNEFITVGWGKKETQFHGSEGKNAAKAVKMAVKKSSTDNGSTSISWRADGTLFAISFVQNSDEQRKFKIFNREGHLLYTSEAVDGLDENLAWRPSGNLIATSQELPHKHVVAFFEKNGLKHRDFSIRLQTSKAKIKNMCWSSDSEILSIWYVDNETQRHHIQLWTENNYHWYLKQTINIKENDSVVYINWSSIFKSGKKLFILTTSSIKVYTYRWTIDHTKGKELHDKSTVAVIDGNNVLLTNFRDNVIPPPMAQQTVDVGEQVLSVVFAPRLSKNNSNSFFCVLNDYSLVFYNFSDNEYVRVGKYENTVKNHSTYYQSHYLWLNDDTIVCCSIDMKDLSLLIQLYDNKEILDDINCPRIIFRMRQFNISPGKTRHIEHIVQSSIDSNIYYIFTTDNNISKLSVCGDHEDDYLHVEESFKQVDVINIDDKDVFISLTKRHRLYINNREAANNITSFYVHSEFLLLTTLQHTLLCFPLNKEGINLLMTSDLTIKPWENNDAEINHCINVRRIERGATLVVSVSKDAKTILQMPRGNLECIQPRLLSFYNITRQINKLKYYEVFEQMRKQRINLNVLYDHDPVAFSKNINKFINDIARKNPNWLNLFLLEIKDEDVTQTIYASCYLNHVNKIQVENVTGKVANICPIMREEMEKYDEKGTLIQPILISLVRGNKNSGIADALNRIKQLQFKQESVTSVSETLKFLLYVVNVNDLFDCALGMYDLNLTMLVAQESQKDPKEYVPFLNNFKNMQPDRMRFEIDKHLMRYESALSHLLKCQDSFEEFVEFVSLHNLYKAALKIIPADSDQYRNTAIVYAEHLLQNAKYEEAGIMFAKGRNFEKSVNAYRLAGCWQESIVMAHYANLSSNDKNVLYKTLISRLKSEKKYNEAAIISSKYMNKIEESILILCEGKLWMDAWREAIIGQCGNIIETAVKPGVLTHAQNLLMEIQNNKRDFEKHARRLEVVRSLEYRKAKQAQYAFPFEHDITTEDGINDMLSDTTSNFGSNTSYNSNSSRSSGRSYKSSKNRRKQQRKLLNLKEGSLFEDIALLRVLHDLITTAYGQKTEVYHIIKMLLQFNEDDLSERLYKELDGFLHLIEATVSKIWITENADNQENGNIPVKEQFLCGTVPPGLIEQYILYPPKKDSSHWTLTLLKETKKSLA